MKSFTPVVRPGVMLRQGLFALSTLLLVQACSHPSVKSGLPSTVEAGPDVKDDGQVVDWDRIETLPRPPDFTPHVDDPAQLEPTLRWLQSLRDGDGGLGRIEGGAVKKGRVVVIGLNPDFYNCQNFANWTVEDLNQAHFLDLSGLDYATEDLRLLEPLVQLQALKLTQPERPRPDASNDQGLAHVARLPRLRYLNLDGFGVEAGGLAALVAAPGLIELELSSNATLELGDLERLAKLTTLSWVALEESFGLRPQWLELGQVEPLHELIAALPNCHFERFEDLTETFFDSLDAVGPHELSIELEAVAAPGQHELLVTTTIVNSGSGPVRISDSPLRNINQPLDRFSDGSLLRVVAADGSWRPLEVLSFGGNSLGMLSLANVIVLGPGERRSFSFPLQLYPGHAAFLVGDNHDSNSTSHDAYAIPATSGTLTLGLELRQDDEQFNAHNTYTGYDPAVHVRALRETDWRGVLRSNTVELRVSPKLELTTTPSSVGPDGAGSN